MGGTCSRQKPLRFLIQGLDAAGKTSFLYRLKMGEVVTTIPTIGFNVEELSYEGIHLTAWDLGGRDKIRALHRHYYPNTDGLIYVIDSNDAERLDQAFDELNSYVFQEEELADKVLMILANKQDIEGSMGPEEIEAKLKEKCTLGSNSCVFVMPCSVTTGEGIWEAFGYFAKKVKENKTEEKVQSGLIPQAWISAAQERENATQEESAGLFHKFKNSWLKDPFSLVKSLLFY